MTVNAVRRPLRRAAASPDRPAALAAPDALAIGEIGQTVFDCPNCSRPLALGARRCPGCGTRLVIGVPLRKASILVGGGLTVGIVAGALGGVVAASRFSPVTAAGAPAPLGSAAAGGGSSAASGSSAPSPTLRPSPAASTPASDSMPSLAASALAQAITVDGRLLAAADPLRAALAAGTFSADDVAQILRTISADSVYGEQLADRVTSWPGSVAVGADLGTLYGSLHDTASAALVASVRNDAAYRSAARAMIQLLTGMRPIDDRARALAAEQGVALPSSEPAGGSAAP